MPKKCPKCNKGEMILKTARRGRYAGREFYGCSRYPDCEKIINLDNSNDVNNFSGFNTKNEKELDLPRTLNARERIKNYQVRFYETLAVDYDLLNFVNLDDDIKKQLKNFSQWRLDFPVKEGINLNNNFKQILLVVYKILTRGHITLVSPRLENSLKRFFNNKVKIKENTVTDDTYLKIFKSDNKTSFWFDSTVEKAFYEKTLYKLLGSGFKKFIIPQVYLSSISDEKDEFDGKQRVDFLININNKKIAIELDDSGHKNHVARDGARDNILMQKGFEVIRIENEELTNNSGVGLEQLNHALKDVKINLGKLNNEEIYLNCLKLAHQFQIVILEALLYSYLDLSKKGVIYFDILNIKIPRKIIKLLLNETLDDLEELIDHTSELYSFPISLKNIVIVDQMPNKKEANSIIISFNENISYQIPTFYLQDISFPYTIAHSDRPTEPTVISNVTEDNLKYFLRYIFRKDDFWEGQFDTILRTLNKKDSVILLPTGSGKSIAFQLAAMLLPGVCIVIDPIIALIDDQIDNLQRIGIDRTIGISSQIRNTEERDNAIRIMGQGEFIFCYIAPERFQTEEFRNTLRSLTVSTPISVIVVDEAHCVSEWGHSFRPAYLNIGRTSRKYCKFHNHIPPLLALTGTASISVLRDVQRELQIKSHEAIITPKTFNREELHFSMIESLSLEKQTKLLGYLQRKLPEEFSISSTSFYQPRGKDTYCGLIFCLHVNGQYGIVEIERGISSNLKIPAKFYSGGSPKGWYDEDYNIYKQKTARDFKNNEFALLIATKAFGMGIDKPNIRYTIHFGIPNSIESFYQEAGRAGRDRKKAECTIFVSNDDKEKTSYLLNPKTPIEEINKIIKERNEYDDDVIRALWFHSQAFHGVHEELHDIDRVINEIGELSKKQKIRLVVEKKAIKEKEKVIQRLLVLGVIADYMIKYSANEITIDISGLNKNNIIKKYYEYVYNYNRSRAKKERRKIEEFINNEYNDFVKFSCKVLIEFIYDVIERGRRGALSAMVQVCDRASNEGSNSDKVDRILREGILNYLEMTYSEELEEIRNASSAGIFEMQELIDSIRSTKDAAEIRGQVSRYLESYPDHPGLFFVRALSELFCTNYNKEIIYQNISAAIKFAYDRYEIADEEIYKSLRWVLLKINEVSSELSFNTLCKLLYEINQRSFAVKLLRGEELPVELYYPTVIYLLSQVTDKAIKVVKY